MSMFARASIAAVLALGATAAAAAPVRYDIDPDHTYPSFEGDHMGGLSVWRGKFTGTKGTIVLNREARSGTVDVEVDTRTVDFGHQGMNEHARKADMLNVEKFPTARYKGRLTHFEGDRPTKVEGELTMMGVTKPLTLELRKFKCMENPMTKAPTCGADAYAVFNRGDFGFDFALDKGFTPETTLRIQVEAIQRK